MINITNKYFIDILKTIITPIIIGILFVIWACYFLLYPITTFPLIFIIFLPLYLVSGSIFGGILILFSIALALFAISITNNVFLLVTEIIWIIIVFILLEKHRNRYIYSTKKLDVEYEILDRDISIIQSSIYNNEKNSSGLHKRIENFQALGNIIQSLEPSLPEEDLILKMEQIPAQFIKKGIWKIEKYNNKDVFAKYVKQNKTSLLIQDSSKNTYFDKKYFKSAISLIVVPIEIEGKFWGTLNGVSYKKQEIFNDSDLRFTHILLNIFSIVIYNANLFHEIAKLAITDTLTGLYTRNYFIERSLDEIQHSVLTNAPLSMAIIDIDDFKKINDTYGHQAGDTVLRKLAEILIDRFRETDVICRYGGEEFIILMPHTNKKESFEILEDLRKKISTEKIFLHIENFQPIQISITISIGIVQFNDEKNIEELIEKSDLALYNAKKTGKNKICLYKEEKK